MKTLSILFIIFYLIPKRLIPKEEISMFRLFKYSHICCAAILAFSFISLSFAQEDTPVIEYDPSLPEVFDDAGNEVYDGSESDVEINSSDYVVRLIYLVPNDRQAQPDIDAKLDVLIKKAQTLFANVMASHGFGEKTFRFETDANGNAVVHHVNGAHEDVYYQTKPSSKITEELRETFDFTQNVYFIAIEISSAAFDAGTVCGYGGDYGLGGQVFVPASGSCFEGAPLDGIDLVAHELGHAFGLQHDFRSFTDIMSYGWGRKTLSRCYAEWLDVHPYFNPGKTLKYNQNTRIKLLSSSFDSAPPYTLRLRFEMTDPDGLYQAQLLTHTTGTSVASGFPELVQCELISGEQSVVEFVTTELLNAVWIYAIDTQGNVVKRRFDIDYKSLAPESEIVNIPDANLAAAIRSTFDYASDRALTKFDIARLPYLHVWGGGVTDLSGLEYASSLNLLNLTGNPIRDLSPILKLPNLKLLYLSHTQLNDLSQVAALNQLTHLALSANEISDLRPLASLTQLEDLTLGENQINDLSPLASLTQLKVLSAGFNQIRDITPLKDLTRLEDLNLQGNQIRDITPLKRLVRLRRLYIDRNEQISDITALADMTEMRLLQLPNPLITDITPLSRMTQLVELSIRNNKISDITPLADMTRLRALNLPNNQVTDITPLLRMTQLVELSLGRNQISDITPLANMTQLQWLYLSLNQISDVSALSGLVNAKEIYLVENPIKNRKPLLALLRNNPDVKIYLDGANPLPVKLSSFKAMHTSAGAVLNWTTESELDNAGFNILRSSTQTGDFKQINTKLIAGAGTTGIRTEYTWTDTTAKPNTVYYYRIVDVSHAGEREHLATVRLRGLVSATGKLSTAWADVKGSR